MVSMVVCPLAVAVHVHQTDAPPKVPKEGGGMDGSPPPGPPPCLLAPTLLPVTVAIGPTIGVALAKLSLMGAAKTAMAEQSRSRMIPKQWRNDFIEDNEAT